MRQVALASNTARRDTLRGAGSLAAYLLAGSLAATLLPAPAGATTGDTASAVAPWLQSRSAAAAALAEPAQPTALRPVDVLRLAKPAVARVRSSSGVGTAFLIDAQGNLVTNCHVVSRASDKGGLAVETEVELEFADDGARASARVVGCDGVGDIAVLNVAGLGPRRQPLRFAKAGSVEVGEDVIAVGFALDFDGGPTVTRGIVRAMRTSHAAVRRRSVGRTTGSTSPVRT